MAPNHGMFLVSGACGLLMRRRLAAIHRCGTTPVNVLQWCRVQPRLSVELLVLTPARMERPRLSGPSNPSNPIQETRRDK